ncbi:MAG TPA: radical SAM protein [Candidatus Atribacteria bacterium]|nr:radical SAM protein [Candidatus Atribacteria bacterium]
MVESAKDYWKEEQGISPSSKVGKFLFALCFPGDYSLGMTNLGYQSIIHLLFEAPDWRGERFFYEYGSRSLESNLPLNSFDIIGFNFSFELDILNLLLLLQEGGIPLFARDRKEKDPWVISGGPAATLNPEIIAPFMDLIVIGEAEKVFPLILALWKEGEEKGESREEKKRILGKIPGVYIPSKIHPVYQQGELRGFEEEGFSFPVKRQWVNINEFETRTFIYTPFSYFQDASLVEISRGCSYRCSFCAGRSIYHPLRQRSLELVEKMIDHVSPWSSKIGLVGADLLSHPALEEIIKYVLDKGKKLTLSSLSALSLVKKTGVRELLSKGEIETITLAPESGSFSARMKLGKGLSDEEWVDLVRELLEKKIKRVKLYFMLGKPEGKVEEDLEFLAKMVAQIKNPQQISVSYSFLVPKPHTALSDWRTPSIYAWEREKRIWERGLGKLGIPFSGESPRLAWIQLLLARGDRLIGEKIPQLLSHPHPWSWRTWQSLLQGLGRDEEWVRSPWKEVKPWQVVDMG